MDEVRYSSESLYQNSEDLVDIIGAIKKIDGVNIVMWSEEVYKLLPHKENVMKSFKKYGVNKGNIEHRYDQYEGIRTQDSRKNKKKKGES